jgi:hypothetical protein
MMVVICDEFKTLLIDFLDIPCETQGAQHDSKISLFTTLRHAQARDVLPPQSKAHTRKRDVNVKLALSSMRGLLEACRFLCSFESVPWSTVFDSTTCATLFSTMVVLPWLYKAGGDADDTALDNPWKTPRRIADAFHDMLLSVCTLVVNHAHEQPRHRRCMPERGSHASEDLHCLGSHLLWLLSNPLVGSILDHAQQSAWETLYLHGLAQFGGCPHGLSNGWPGHAHSPYLVLATDGETSKVQLKGCVEDEQGYSACFRRCPKMEVVASDGVGSPRSVGLEAVLDTKALFSTCIHKLLGNEQQGTFLVFLSGSQLLLVLRSVWSKALYILTEQLHYEILDPSAPPLDKVATESFEWVSRRKRYIDHLHEHFKWSSFMVVHLYSPLYSKQFGCFPILVHLLFYEICKVSLVDVSPLSRRRRLSEARSMVVLTRSNDTTSSGCPRYEFTAVPQQLLWAFEQVLNHMPRMTSSPHEALWLLDTLDTICFNRSNHIHAPLEWRHIPPECLFSSMAYHVPCECFVPQSFSKLAIERWRDLLSDNNIYASSLTTTVIVEKLILGIIRAGAKASSEISDSDDAFVLLLEFLVSQRTNGDTFQSVLSKVWESDALKGTFVRPVPERKHEGPYTSRSQIIRQAIARLIGKMTD